MIKKSAIIISIFITTIYTHKKEEKKVKKDQKGKRQTLSVTVKFHDGNTNDHNDDLHGIDKNDFL